MCETKTVLLSIAISLLVAISFYIYQAHSENKVGHHSEIIIQDPCENEYKKFWLNGGESLHLVDGDIVSCNCCNGYMVESGKRCEKYMWWDQVEG